MLTRQTVSAADSLSKSLEVEMILSVVTLGTRGSIHQTAECYDLETGTIFTGKRPIPINDDDEEELRAEIIYNVSGRKYCRHHS